MPYSVNSVHIYVRCWKKLVDIISPVKSSSYRDDITFIAPRELSYKIEEKKWEGYGDNAHLFDVGRKLVDMASPVKIISYRDDITFIAKRIESYKIE
jgi:hypothetical protein